MQIAHKSNLIKELDKRMLKKELRLEQAKVRFEKAQKEHEEIIEQKHRLEAKREGPFQASDMMVEVASRAAQMQKIFEDVSKIQGIDPSFSPSAGRRHARHHIKTAANSRAA